jgi:hypothetical protein
MSVAPPLGKELASVGELNVSHRSLLSLRALPDKKTRDDAVKKLRDFLATTGETPMPAHEMAKLWKAIFYCR